MSAKNSPVRDSANYNKTIFLLSVFVRACIKTTTKRSRRRLDNGFNFKPAGPRRPGAAPPRLRRRGGCGKIITLRLCRVQTPMNP
ncbi:hypothetical protein TcasGA2_TC012456 [Tribolium castaneum]|uniref:Uncharacterized protein n=1 Tax=Tribolium castaneum TaxID=7070 RepID=D6X2E4_TRICA|nr:hypothetical protein TcasGA2_TC012456 [Tribolium castaneum]